VLIVRVHPELLTAQALPAEADGAGVWRKRYRSIVGFERHLHDSGTRVVKVFLHLSREEQRKRFLERLDAPDKRWKFDPADLREREVWDDYQKAYEACIAATTTKAAPWYVVPADDKRNARLIVSRILIGALEDIPMAYPEPDAARRREMAEFRRQLEAEGPA
jgi:polyphosphate kinase 2 (PPK2 family)